MIQYVHQGRLLVSMNDIPTAEFQTQFEFNQEMHIGTIELIEVWILIEVRRCFFSYMRHKQCDHSRESTLYCVGFDHSCIVEMLTISAF